MGRTIWGESPLLNEDTRWAFSVIGDSGSPEESKTEARKYLDDLEKNINKHIGFQRNDLVRNMPDDMTWTSSRLFREVVDNPDPLYEWANDLSGNPDRTEEEEEALSEYTMRLKEQIFNAYQEELDDRDYQCECASEFSASERLDRAMSDPLTRQVTARRWEATEEEKAAQREYEFRLRRVCSLQNKSDVYYTPLKDTIVDSRAGERFNDWRRTAAKNATESNASFVARAKRAREARETEKKFSGGSESSGPIASSENGFGGPWKKALEGLGNTFGGLKHTAKSTIDDMPKTGDIDVSAYDYRRNGKTVHVKAHKRKR